MDLVTLLGSEASSSLKRPRLLGAALLLRLALFASFRRRFTRPPRSALATPLPPGLVEGRLAPPPPPPPPSPPLSHAPQRLRRQNHVVTFTGALSEK